VSQGEAGLTDDASCCARWGSDGYIYFAAGDQTIHRVPEGGGPVERVTSCMEENDGEQGYFEIMPDGDTGVFSVFADPPRLEAFTISTGERRVLTNGMRSWVTSTGHVVFGTLEGQILAAPFDVDALELTGEPVPVVQGVGVTSTEDVMFTLSANGTLLYWAAPTQASGIELIWIERAGRVSSVEPGFTVDPSGDNRSWTVSPDGRRIAYQNNTAAGIPLHPAPQDADSLHALVAAVVVADAEDVAVEALGERSVEPVLLEHAPAAGCHPQHFALGIASPLGSDLEAAGPVTRLGAADDVQDVGVEGPAPQVDPFPPVARRPRDPGPFPISCEHHLHGAGGSLVALVGSLIPLRFFVHALVVRPEVLLRHLLLFLGERGAGAAEPPSPAEGASRPS